jgi:Flp pilus assembly protein TadG
MTRPWRILGDEKGAAAVEFAGVLAIFMVMIMGSLHYGLYLWTANALQQTANRTARCMGILQTDCAASRAYSASKTETFTKSVAAAYGMRLTSSNLTLNAATSCAGQGSNYSRITISYTFVGVASGLLPGTGSAPLSASACFPNQS